MRETHPLVLEYPDGETVRWCERCGTFIALEKFRDPALHNPMICPRGITEDMLDAEENTFIGKSRELREAVFDLLRSLRDTLRRK
ncbi:MAG: hypothetical protein KC729_00195 [Candidatus Eisenbacteria bacterium]|uniref:Uncharacterized protein n=1 Tax=Eiseniibacteriota bacterium TaxID=2212470 RepID=A0A956RMV2_UNCEI|nr:hypothetical protein [Candidatus Eisenbacteria bacterium]